MSKNRLFAGITSRSWTGLTLVWLALLALFFFLYGIAQRAVINEIRNHAKGVAVALAAGLDGDTLASLATPGDMERPEYFRIQKRFAQVALRNPDIRYIYTMRRCIEEGAGEHEYEYLVDGPARDINANGMIDPDEISETPGTRYDASALPELIAAWYRPGADPATSPDPPYPDVMSGYAPVKNELDQTRAIVGVDIAAETVSNKLLALRMVMLLVWVVLALLITLVVQLHYQQQDVLESNRVLTADLATRNDMLKAANSRLAASNEQVRRELSRRNGYRKPLELSGNGGMIFDKYYLACHFGGPHSGDVLMLDEDHVGLYLATVPAHGVTAAFISGILKSSAASGARDPAASTAHLHIDPTQPGLVLASLNTLLLREFPDAAPVAMAYAVMDIAAATFTVAVAGSAPVFIGDPDTRKLTKWNREAGAPLGKEHGSTYPVAVQRLACNQRLVLTSTGQEDKANDALKSNVDAPAWELLQLTRQSMGEDSSILIAEVR